MVTDCFIMSCFTCRSSWQWVLEPACPDWKQHHWDQVGVPSLLSSFLSFLLLFLLLSFLSPLSFSPSLPPLSFSSPPLLLLPPHFLSFLLFSLPHSAQLSLEQKEAFHLNLNLLACQQSSEKSKVSGHHNGSVLLSSSVLRTHYPFCSYMFKEGIWEQS